MSTEWTQLKTCNNNYFRLFAKHAILYGGMNMTSSLSRSAVYCGVHYKFDTGHLLDAKFDCC